MFTSQVFPPLADSLDGKRPPLRLPLRVLQAIPAYVTVDPAVVPFNVAATFENLVGSQGQARTLRILQPRIWAPGWDPTQLHTFVSSAFAGRYVVFRSLTDQELRAPEFPGTGTLANRDASNYPRYDIVHAIGR
jgi:hypothetical protein